MPGRIPPPHPLSTRLKHSPSHQPQGLDFMAVAVISVTGQHKFCSHNTSCTLFHWLPLQGPQTTCSNSNQHTWSTISDPGCLRMLSSSRPCTGLVWMLFNKPYGLELPQKRAESRQLLGTHLPLQKQNFGRAQVKLTSLLWEIYCKHMIHITVKSSEMIWKAQSSYSDSALHRSTPRQMLSKINLRIWCLRLQ